MNILIKVKLKLREWLEIDDNFDFLNKKIDMINKKCEGEITSIGIKLNDLSKKVNVNRETISNIVNVSTDVHEGNGSWCVISVGGNLQYVKFVDLNRKNIREIVDFLKRYEAGRHTIDSPQGYIFEKELMYFHEDKNNPIKF